ncbi:histidine kinase [Streptomyces albus]|uniref:sensor histidine kinase n=1 Tax=Streptomyces albus TaxID=1888 RepID=UPI0024ACBF12|nr:ATP-binding protein [Streptomyces albus]MDI6410007.1 histidine kinase [Streptomyces albus]
MISAFGTRSRPRQVLLAVAGAVLGTLAVLEGLNAPLGPVALLTAGSGLLCVGALLVADRPLPRRVVWAAAASGLVTVVGALVAQRAENTPGGVETGALLCLIACVVRRCPPRQAVALSAVLAAVVVALPLRLEARDSITLGVMVVLACFAVPLMVALGLCLRLRDTLRVREREAVLREQRLEYARDLHDFVAHHVTAIVARTRAARFAAGAGKAPSAQDLDRMLAQIEEAGSQALGSMRSMVSSLRDTSAPAPTRPPGDLRSLRELADEFAATGLRPEVALDPRLTDRPLPPQVHSAVHRVVQEALTNVRRHAAGAERVKVRVALRPDGKLEAEVTDDGGAPAAAAPADGAGFGLVGLTERVEEAGGTLTAGPRPGGGWRVLAVLPSRTAAPPA